MMRGLIGGALWGAVVGAIVLVAASLLLPLPDTTDGPANVIVSDAPPPAPTVAVSPATPFIPDAITAPATTPDGRGGAPALPRAGSAAAVAPDAAPPGQEPPQRPVEAVTDPGSIAPAPEEADDAGIVPAEEAARPAETTAAVAEAPAPEGETAPEVATAPSPRVTGAAVAGAAAGASPARAAALVPAMPAGGPEPAPVDPVAPTGVEDQGAAEAEPAGAAAAAPAPEMPAGSAEVAAAAEAAPDASPLPDAPAAGEAREAVVSQAPAEDAADTAPAPAPGPLPAAESAQAAAEADAAAPAAIGQPTGTIGTRVSQGFADRATGVRVNRPSAGGEAAFEEDLEVAVPAAAEAGAASDADLPALRRYAAAFENPDGKPLVSVVVVDLGPEAGGLAADALANMPFPVTFAVPVGRADAAEAAATFRAAGFEVAMIPDRLPELASPADVEVAYGAFGAKLPETVAVLEPPDGGFQGSRAQAEQIVAILGEAGRALISFDRGLDNALRVARREGLPAAVVSRDLDAAGEGPDEIRRALDRAAFRAQQEGSAVVVLRSRPESISTLFAWALEGRAATVALAPVSATIAAE